MKYLTLKEIEKVSDQIWAGFNIGDKVIIEENDAIYKGKAVITRTSKNVYEVKLKNEKFKLDTDGFEETIGNLCEEGIKLLSFKVERR